MEEISEGIWLWRASHPEWRRTSELVGSYAVKTGGGLAVVDPLVPEADEGDAILAQLTGLAAGGSCAVFITIPYHVRSAERVADALGGRIVGHTLVGKRLQRASLLVDYTAEQELPLGAVAVSVGARRAERALHFPDARAVALGDSIVSVPAGLRVWMQTMPDDEKKWAAYHDRALPGLAALADLDVDHVLVTHGEPVIGGGGRAVRAALAADPVAYRVGEMSPSVRPAAPVR